MHIILTIILIIIVINIIGKIFFRFFLRKLQKHANNLKSKSTRSYGYKEGEIKVNHRPNEKKVFSQDVGEYVDFEEV